MRTRTLATLVVVLGLGPFAISHAAAPFCFKDQNDRVYTLHVLGTAGPMVQLAGTEFTPANGFGPSSTRIISGAAYVAGIGFAVASITKFHQHKDNPTQLLEGSLPLVPLVPATTTRTVTLAHPSFTSGEGTETSVDGVQTSLTLTPADCVDPGQ